MKITSRVLLADDEQTFALTTARVLERHGMPCDAVATADEAREALAANTYDVLVTDIKMPGNDDLSLFESLKAREDAPAVILVTGYPSVDTAVHSVELGAFAYLVKPFDMEEFIGKVREAQRQTALRRKLVNHSRVARDLEERIGALKAELARRSPRDLDQTACEYLHLLLLNVGETVMEATDMISLMQPEGRERPVRELTTHPELDMLRNAVDETVRTLERTKQNFKSKELAQLRRRLEKLQSLTGGTGGMSPGA